MIVYTKELLIESAKKFKTRSEWARLSPKTYTAAQRKGLLEACSAHMIWISERNKWNKESCLQEAQKYQFKKDWIKYSAGSYGAAHKNGWIKECSSHMKQCFKKSKWTKEISFETASKCKNFSEFIERHNGCYEESLRQGWVPEIKSLFFQNLQTPWTTEEILRSAAKYKSISEWREKNYLTYAAASKRGILRDLTKNKTRLIGVSKAEKEIMFFIKKFYPNAKDLWKKVTIKNQKTKISIDVYVSELNKGVEFNGLYWHGKGFKRKWTNSPEEYHKTKKLYFKKVHGIEYLTIHEKDWKKNRQECLLKISKYLGLTYE